MNRLLLALSLLAVTAPEPASAKDQPTTISSPEDVGMLHEFAECIVRKRERTARALLAMDYRTNAYDRELRSLIASEKRRCVPFAFGKLRFARVLIAGALAEHLLPEAVGGSRLGDRVAYDPSRPAVAARDDGEYLGLCAVRTMPDEAGALLAAKPASPEERQAAGNLLGRLGPCVRAGASARINVPGLRALLALAAYRLATQAAPVAPRPAGR